MANSAYREFNFGLGEVIDAVRDQVQRFAEERIAPRANEIDRSNVFPRDLWRGFSGLGFFGHAGGPGSDAAGAPRRSHPPPTVSNAAPPPPPALLPTLAPPS